MNDRRVFLTKDEVKNLGIELTENTTDDIAVLYLPLNGQWSQGTGPIYFNYRTKDHTNVNAAVTSGSYKARINNKNFTVPIYVGGALIVFNYKLTSSTTDVNASYSLYYNSLFGSTSGAPSLSDNYKSTVPISDCMDVTDMYIKIDIPKIKVQLIGHGTFKDFLIKYKSGNIPADTIFYEPYED